MFTRSNLFWSPRASHTDSSLLLFLHCSDQHTQATLLSPISETDTTKPQTSTGSIFHCSSCVSFLRWNKRPQKICLTPRLCFLTSHSLRARVCARVLSRVRLCVTPGTVPSRLLRPWDSPGKNTGVGWFPSLGDLPVPGIEPVSPAWQSESLPLSYLGSPGHTLTRLHCSAEIAMVKVTNDPHVASAYSWPWQRWKQLVVPEGLFHLGFWDLTGSPPALVLSSGVSLHLHLNIGCPEA